MARPVAVNPVILNAALTGIITGGQAASASPVVSAAQQASALSLAVAIDALIAADATLTAAGATVVPVTAVETNALTTKPALMQSLCYSATFQRLNTDATAGTDQASIAAAIVAQYVAVNLAGSIL